MTPTESNPATHQPHSDFPSLWQSRAAAALCCVPAVCEVWSGAAPSYEILYLPLIILWACRLPLSSAMAGALLASLVMALRPFGAPVGVVTTASIFDGLRRFVILGTSAVLTAHLWTSRERERELARRDGLTGLANRRAFIETVAAESARCRRNGRPLSLAYLDCDHFKELNDSLGHLAGDRLLSTIGRVLQSSTREYDTAARLGGDEFALLLAEANADNAERIAHRIRDDLHGAIRAEGWSVTVSIGVATFAEPLPPAVELIAVADAAMYEAKKSGAGRIVAKVVDQSVATAE